MKNALSPFKKRKGPLLKSEKEVLRHLGAKDFRSLSKESIIRFVSSIDRMDPQVALGIIDKYPEIAQSGLNIAKEQTSQLKAILESNDKSVRAQYDQTKRVADILDNVLKNENSTPEERIEAIKGLENVLKCNEHIDKRNKNFLLRLFGMGAAALLTLLAAVFGVIGLSTKSSLSELDDDENDKA